MGGVGVIAAALGLPPVSGQPWPHRSIVLGERRGGTAQAGKGSAFCLTFPLKVIDAVLPTPSQVNVLAIDGIKVSH